jgi:hypothetical protein
MELDPADIVIVWDTAVVTAERYARLVALLGDLVRAEGGLGVERIRLLTGCSDEIDARRTRHE